jgi:hypothetical protein
LPASAAARAALVKAFDLTWAVTPRDLGLGSSRNSATGTGSASLPAPASSAPPLPPGPIPHPVSGGAVTTAPPVDPAPPVSGPVSHASWRAAVQAVTAGGPVFPGTGWTPNPELLQAFGEQLRLEPARLATTPGPGPTPLQASAVHPRPCVALAHPVGPRKLGQHGARWRLSRT